jgi:hypothetical protein
MAQLTPNIFRDYFAGSWVGRITRNGEYQRKILYNWPKAFEKYSSLGIEAGRIAPPNMGALDDTRQVAIAGWRTDIRRWIQVWHNEFGGYGEIQWTSQEEINGITTIYGFAQETKQETDDLTDHILMVEMIDNDNFSYTIRSFRKGIVEISFRRVKTSEDLKELIENQVERVKGFEELIGL